MKSTQQLAGLLLIALASSSCFAQPSQRERALAVTAALHAEGQRHEVEGLTLWIEPDGLDENCVQQFVVQLQQGLAVVREYLGDLQDDPETGPRVEVFMSPGVGISHVRYDAPTMLYMPTWRIRDRTAPYLHEFVHAVASWSWRHSEWLGEGLANHVATAVEPISGGYHHSNVVPDRLLDVHRHLDSLEGREVLALIGPTGRRRELPPDLEAINQKVLTDRTRYARPFYALSWSFVDFIVARKGLANLRVVSADPVEIARLKRLWLAQLRAEAEASGRDAQHLP